MNTANENAEYLLSAQMATAKYVLRASYGLGQVGDSFHASRQFDKKCIHLHRNASAVARQDRASSRLGTLNFNTPTTARKIIELPRNCRVMRRHLTILSDISCSNYGTETHYGLSSLPSLRMKVYGHNRNEETLERTVYWISSEIGTSIGE